MKTLFSKPSPQIKGILSKLLELRPFFCSEVDALYCWFHAEVVKQLDQQVVRQARIVKTDVYPATLTYLSSVDDVDQIIGWVAGEIKKRGRVKINKPSTYGKREAQVSIIQLGLQDLEDLNLKLGRDEGARNHAIEGSMVQLDARRFQKYINTISEYRNDEIRVYNMTDPTAQPFIVAAKSLQRPTCENIRTLMVSGTHRTPPDLWAREHGTHQLTRDRYCWIYIEPDEDVTSLDLEFIDPPLPIMKTT